MEEKFSVINKTKSKLPNLPVFDLKNNILGKNYSLSLAYISKGKIKEINKNYRNKNNATNILSFSLSKTSGEILICPTLVKKETKKFDKNFKELLVFLIIHGMLHLKGFDHGRKMEKAEEKYLSCTKF
ncbi:MAG: putative rRNA maturation factor [Candidatus Nomurabacteria bacterium GW2011_GWE1_32_28]|uniref:Endoribonuclease YbeY n=1 Tax=Candidatus Nomurabacteria bacterium GW2011_GWF1_31_48 TaxID=1618767 RepID=A0A0F9YGG9_9BACT|nr:MAG: putative rRNA maturation factor [Candidatus Nomurabacteria bacterium GW2011_GWF2_30_133]KKP29067.1 MAG: putative rRNA maturation factor [Candidatus Nomurabacteria bacterium GW2011_GWE2_31_40]KKP30523.1 MAG: putative rRNA maturation factor [Candidatus Nomurabacteria bacterium GW2011_GWF1_31_48]KKP35008.1 MAG: putative rRNA maturation factor [Candidatus Nomurabacteria bacterium GW2011_GWE1_32_28]HAS80624.1 rRNA maturation RNase YbeY [Candidatus Nomurabacteria bacterium]